MDRRHDDGEPPFNGCREANSVLQEGDSDRHRRLSRDSPDDSRTGVNSSAFRASLKDGGEMPAATGPSGSPNGGRGGVTWPFSPALERTPYVCAARRLTPALVATSAVVPRSAAKPPGTFAMCAKLASLSRRKQSCSRLYCGSFRSFRYFS